VLSAKSEGKGKGKERSLRFGRDDTILSIYLRFCLQPWTNLNL